MDNLVREKLHLFMFLLLRDYITVGDFNKIIRDIRDVGDDDIIYTDKNFADFVKTQFNKIIE